MSIYRSVRFTYPFRVFSMSILISFFSFFMFRDTRVSRLPMKKVSFLRVFAVAHGVQVAMGVIQFNSIQLISISYIYTYMQTHNIHLKE